MIVQQRQELSEYMEELHANWFDYQDDELVSSLSSVGLTTSLVMLNKNWEPLARPPQLSMLVESASIQTKQKVWEEQKDQLHQPSTDKKTTNPQKPNMDMKIL